jgi:hypothetical protein
VLFDISSAGGGEVVTISAKEVCDKWEKGSEGIDQYTTRPEII